MDTEQKIKQLPEYFRPIMWSYTFNDIDPEANAELVICQTINYGTLKHLRWIRQQYGIARIQNVLATTPATAFRAPAKKLAGIIFNISKFNDTPRGPHHRGANVIS